MHKIRIKLPSSNTDKERTILEKQGLIYKQEAYTGYTHTKINIEIGTEDFDITIEKEN